MIGFDGPGSDCCFRQRFFASPVGGMGIVARVRLKVWRARDADAIVLETFRDANVLFGEEPGKVFEFRFERT